MRNALIAKYEASVGGPAAPETAKEPPEEEIRNEEGEEEEPQEEDLLEDVN